MTIALVLKFDASANCKHSYICSGTRVSCKHYTLNPNPSFLSQLSLIISIALKLTCKLGDLKHNKVRPTKARGNLKRKLRYKF